VIRAATPADLGEPLILTLAAIEDDSVAPFSALGMEFPPDDPADVLRHADMVLVLGDPPTGFATLGVLGEDAHLEQMAVHPDHSNQGHGTQLLKTAITHATEQGHQRLVLTTFRDIPWNGPWYARHGFTELPYEDCGPELRAVRDEEIREGLDAMAPRLAMSRNLS
jgi:GNAT superfamily N-acetyltransferase